MSKTYQALVKAEQLRATQDPAALARRVARTAEEGETLRAELRVCQEQLAALLQKADAAATIDDELSRQVSQLATQQERLAIEPRELLDVAIQQFRTELDRRWAGVQGQGDQLVGLSLRLEQVREGVVPTVESIRRQFEELQRRSDELQRTQQTERQTRAATLGALREELARALQSVEEQQREQRRLLDELASLRVVQQDGALQTQRALSESFDSISTRLKNVEVLQHGDADRLQAEVLKLQQGGDRLRVALAESEAALAAANAANVEALRADIDQLREQLAATDPHRIHEGPEEPLANGDLSPQAMHAVQEALENMQGAQRSSVERLAAIEDTQSRSDRRLHDMLGTLEALATGQTQSAGEVDSLRMQLVTLTESVERTQVTAAQAARSARASDDAHTSTLALLQQRIAELQTDRATLRDALGSAKSSLAEQLEVLAAGLESLHAQLGPLLEAQPRQRELAEAVSRIQGTVEETGRRISANEQTQSATLTGLRQQLEVLQADSETWHDVSFAMQSVLDRQQASTGEVDALRTQVTRMLEAQQRQQQLFENLWAAPVNSADGLTDDESIGSADLASLRRQVVALQADRLNLDAFLESRFEILCDILDAEMQAKLDELRRDSGLMESLRASSKKVADAVVRLAASIPGLRKRSR